MLQFPGETGCFIRGRVVNTSWSAGEVGSEMQGLLLQHFLERVGSISPTWLGRSFVDAFGGQRKRTVETQWQKAGRHRDDDAPLNQEVDRRPLAWVWPFSSIKTKPIIFHFHADSWECRVLFKTHCSTYFHLHVLRSVDERHLQRPSPMTFLFKLCSDCPPTASRNDSWSTSIQDAT